MKRALLVLAVLVGCKKDPKECAALVDRTEQQIRDERRQSDAFNVLIGHVLGNENDGELPRVDLAAWPFEPGLVLHVDPEDNTVFEDGVDAALAAAACEHRRDKATEPVRIYLLARGATPAARFAARVAWIDAAAKAWQVPFEILLPVQLPKEVRYYNWPKGTSSAVKELGREILDAEDREASIKRLQEKIRIASAGCPEIAKRTLEWGEGGEIRLAMPQGLRDCGCNGVDASTVIGLYHIFSVSSSDKAWVRVSSSEGLRLQDKPTVGELVAGAKADGKTILRVPPAPAREVPPLACDKVGPAIMVRGIEQWDPAPPKDYQAFVEGWLDELDACVARNPPARGAVCDFWITTDGSLLQPGEGETILNCFGVSELWEVEQCMRQRFDLPNQERGYVRAEMYVPGKPRPD